MIFPALVAGLLAAAPAAGPPPCRLDEADHASRSSRFREAAAAYRQCQDAARHDGNAATLARALIGESNALRSLGRLQESRVLAQLGLEAARPVADPELLAAAHEAVGDASFSLRRYEPALQSYGAALPLWRQAGDLMAEAADLKNIGIAYLSLRQIDQALLYLEEASRKDPEAGQGALAVSILGNLGTAYLRVGAHRSALERFEEALRVAERLGFPIEIHDVLGRLGWLHLSLGFPDAALQDFRRALAIESAAPHGHRVWVREGLAEALETTGNLEEARQAYQELLALYRRANDPTGVTYSLNGLADQESRLDPRAARLLFQEALETSRGAEGRFAWDSWRGLARLDRRAGDLDRAVAEYDEAFRAFHAFRQALAEPRARALSSTPDLASELLEALAERGGADDALRAFEVFERSHGSVMLETLRAGGEDGPAEGPGLSVSALRARAADLPRRLLAPETGSAEERRLLDELLRVEATIDEIVFADRGRRSGPPADVATVEQVQTLLGPRRALLAYSFGPDRLVAVVLTERKLSVRLLDAPVEDLARRISVYLDLVGESSSEGWRTVSRELYDILVGPFAEELSGPIDTLIIVPDGSLAFLPFDTLLSPTPGGERHLLERYRIFSVPSATVLRELTRPSTGTGSAGTLAVAGPGVGTGAASSRLSPLANQARRIYDEQGLDLKALPHVASEARHVLEIAGPPGQLLSGAGATEEAFRAMPLAQYRVLHFATHGLLSERAPERSALVLVPGPSGEQDGYLQAREIAQLHLEAELVVLSACRSSRGRLLAGEGAEGLARAFLQAGARSVVASLWDVEDAPTEALMSSFYRHLAAGEAKADALRAAKLERIGQDPSSVRHWAAFVLFGDGLGTVKFRGADRSAGTGHGSGILVLLGLAAAGVLAGVLLLRRRI